MTTFQFLPNPSSGNFAIRRLNLESDVMPSRADGGNGGRTRTDAVVKHHIALVGIGAYQVLYQGYRLLCRMIYNPQIQISVVSGTKRSIFRQKNKTKRSKKRLHTTLIKPEQKVNEDLCSGFIVS